MEMTVWSDGHGELVECADGFCCRRGGHVRHAGPCGQLLRLARRQL